MTAIPKGVAVSVSGRDQRIVIRACLAIQSTELKGPHRSLGAIEISTREGTGENPKVPGAWACSLRVPRHAQEQIAQSVHDGYALDKA